jgi:hypothetical protein
MTAVSDDEYGGDSQNNGATTATPGSWRGVNIQPMADACKIENTLLRYSGFGSVPSVILNNSLSVMRSTRVEHSSAIGFALSDAAEPMDNLVAFDCAGTGIDLVAGLEDLRHATVTACSGFGIRRQALYTGLTYNSNSWNNGAGGIQNFDGFSGADLFNSNGDAALAGSNGNMFVDPLFVDPSLAVGDLTLQSSSPVIGKADFLTAQDVAADHFDGSRISDADFAGGVQPDMGAYEYVQFFLGFQGQPIMGQTMYFSLEGLVSQGKIFLALLDGNSFISPYGMILAGTSATELIYDDFFAGFPYPVSFPNSPALFGFPFGVQAAGLAPGNPLRGNLTNVYRGFLQD